MTPNFVGKGAARNFFVFNPLVLAYLEAQMQRKYYGQAANEIARRTRQNARFSSYKRAVKVKRKTDGVAVFSDSPFSHLDEWGSVNNSPSAAMRRAVDSVGLDGKGVTG
jgi:hypothetical protein